MKEVILTLELYLIVIVISMLVAFLIKGMLVVIRLFNKKPAASVSEPISKGK